VLRPYQVPEFPEVSFTLQLRKTITKQDQRAILDELRKISYHINPKIWIAALWLSTYINVRPAELMAVKEEHIDLKQGRILIPDPKERDPKFMYLLDEDLEIIESLPRGLPGMCFFRHLGGLKGTRQGQKFGDRYVWKWWKKACANLGIEGIDLYGGTRHSSMIDLRRRHSTEDVKRAAGTRTNKALERYLHITADEVRPLYADARSDNELITSQKGLKKAKILKIKE